jgi:hypothetical protein
MTRSTPTRTPTTMEDYVNRVADYLTLNPSTLRDSVTAHKTNSSAWTSSGLSRSACDRYDRGGCPLNPGGGGALPTGQIPPVGTCRLPTAGPYIPL